MGANEASSLHSQSLQPVAIMEVNLENRQAQGMTRRYSKIMIDLRYHVGGMHVTPAVGEQWFVTRADTFQYRLVSKIPDNAPEMAVEPVLGQVQVGSSGPLELHGSRVNIRGGIITLNGMELRSQDGVLERNAGTTEEPEWEPFAGAVSAELQEELDAKADSTDLDAKADTTRMYALRPVQFVFHTAVTGFSFSDRAYTGRALTGANMRVSEAPVGSDLSAVVQHWDGAEWADLGTLTISNGSTAEATLVLAQEQVTGDMLRLNVTSVGSETAATGMVVDVLISEALS